MLMRACIQRLQGNSLNKYGELYMKRYPQLKIKIVDGSSLVVAIVLNSIPKEASQVLLCGKPNKVSYAITSALCERGTKVRQFYLRKLSRQNVNVKSLYFSFTENILISLYIYFNIGNES